ncbi:Ctr copper transporter [Lentinula raphanica]|uniref:Copper transport protein n=1 Tax=Lentinula raphanica TaxID=153919 RepID=A0AA38ULF7_9AGAR|nr:Ctr copper transporter [Lentinula raphanica]KAJ3974404.1 Ctr copper transporter [Lentinula raphanica]
MDMDSSSSTNMTMMMKNYLHFTAGDNLLFQTWHPDSSGAIAGACIGLVVIALLERWLFAIRSGLESYWHHRALGLASKDASAAKCGDDAASANSKSPASSGQNQRTVPPFIAAHDVSRGAIYAVQALLGYILMLAVMTFQAAYVISIILGLGIGEVLFGRMNHHNA